MPKRFHRTRLLGASVGVEVESRGAATGSELAGERGRVLHYTQSTGPPSSRDIHSPFSFNILVKSIFFLGNLFGSCSLCTHFLIFFLDVLYRFPSFSICLIRILVTFAVSPFY